MSERAFAPYKKTLLELPHIMYRNLFIFVNAIIFAVVVLLFIFGEKQASLFLGVITAFNALLGIAQDSKMRFTLEQLQMLTAVQSIRRNADGSETLVYIEEIQKGDHIHLVLGNQIPCDGAVIESQGMEVSEALITGESDSCARTVGMKVQAGDIVTAGSGVFVVEHSYDESRISKITGESKKYVARPSPIQQSVALLIRRTSYLLMVVIIFVVARGVFVGESHALMVLNIGALASAIIPQGLLVITTLLFALGASSYSKQHVLFQEINATEKLGRIKNLCMDKTGTLTGNNLIVEEMLVPEGVAKEDALQYCAGYLAGKGDVSQTVRSIEKYLSPEKFLGTVGDVTPFSSWRQCGAVCLESHGSSVTIFLGAPDVLSKEIHASKDKQWVEETIARYIRDGKRILCVARAAGSNAHIPSESGLSVVALFVIGTDFREGVAEAIDFFQERGVRIRIISGDHPDTVRAVALSLGVADTEHTITGSQIEAMSDTEFDSTIATYTVFARIVPEQKVRIIEALKKDGFTAMIGDGANDALAIKKADLGIAMFDGASATRQLASVVLVNNSFADLPGGVKLADNFIRNIEIFTSLFINQCALSLFIFIILSVFGYSFPLTPLNITFINYFTVGIPGLVVTYWATKLPKKVLPTTTESFLSRVTPFSVLCASVQSVAVAIVFFLSPANLKTGSSNILVAVACILSGFVFLVLVSIYHRGLSKAKSIDIVILGIVEVILIILALQVKASMLFFNITTPYPAAIFFEKSLLVVLVFSALQYVLTKAWQRKPGI